MELCNTEAGEIIASSSPSLLGAETEVLPKGHLGFLSLMLNTQTTQVPLHSGCSFKKGNTKGQMHKALTEKLFPKTEVGSNKYSLL